MQDHSSVSFLIEMRMRVMRIPDELPLMNMTRACTNTNMNSAGRVGESVIDRLRPKIECVFKWNSMINLHIYYVCRYTSIRRQGISLAIDYTAKFILPFCSSALLLSLYHWNTITTASQLPSICLYVQAGDYWEIESAKSSFLKIIFFSFRSWNSYRYNSTEFTYTFHSITKSTSEI